MLRVALLCAVVAASSSAESQHCRQIKSLYQEASHLLSPRENACTARPFSCMVISNFVVRSIRPALYSIFTKAGCTGQQPEPLEACALIADLPKTAMSEVNEMFQGHSPKTPQSQLVMAHLSISPSIETSVKSMSNNLLEHCKGQVL